jgi:hypothetical protein
MRGRFWTLMHVNEDYQDMLFALNDAGAEFIVVGAYALGAHGFPRATGDIDFWVRPTAENASRVWRALEKFGAPRSGVSADDFSQLGTVFQVGVRPTRIDFLTEIDGVDFDDAWRDRETFAFAGSTVSVLSRHWLIVNKRATGRPKDLVDAEVLERDGLSS